MTQSRFPMCLAETLRWEGGYSDDKDDPGGPTMCGIIQRVYDAWRDNMGLPRRHVRDSEPREREAIYRQQYWSAVRGDELPPGIDLTVFDFGVNSGPGRSVKSLQRVLGLTPDGAIGAITIRAAWDAANQGRTADVISALMTERRRFLRQIKHYKTFGRGWERRCDGVEALALKLCPAPVEAIQWPPTAIEQAPQPLPDVDAQSASQGRAPPDTAPPRAGALSRLKGRLLAALGLGSIANELSDAAPSIDASTAIGLWDRVEPMVSRLFLTTGGQIALAVVAVGVAAILLGRSADRHAEFN